MPLVGNLATMPLPDLLQWIGSAGKTGRLEIARGRVRKNILLRDGKLIGCTSDDPSDMLGHHLVARGSITEVALREALQRQQADRIPLGEALVAMGLLTRDDLRRHLEQKTEEAIFGLFVWPGGEFRFHEGPIDDPNLVAVDLRVEDVLLRGAQRLDESARIREVFVDQGVVLGPTDRAVPAEAVRSKMARSVFDLVNGERTIAEILLHSHASEFLVTKFLYELHRLGILKIVARKAIAPPDPEPLWSEAAEDKATPTLSRRGTAGTATAPAPAPPVPEIDATDLGIARKLADRGDYEAALDILDKACKARPGDPALRALLAEAEATFVERAYRHYLPPNKIPFLTRPIESLTGENISPVEYFLVSRIDGTWDIRSIIQIAPIREVEALRTLKKLRERGILDLKDPA